MMFTLGLLQQIHPGKGKIGVNFLPQKRLHKQLAPDAPADAGSCISTAQAITLSVTTSSELHVAMQAPDKYEVNPDLVPDAIHPNAEGFRRLLDECYEPALLHSAQGSIL